MPQRLRLHRRDRSPSGTPTTIHVFVEVRLRTHGDDQLAHFEQAIHRYPEVVECYMMTGDCDYLLRVVAGSVAEYHAFLDGRLRRLRGVLGTKSSIAMRQVKQPAKTGRPRTLSLV